eukprot:3143108-Amphidinium_carterae.2
MSKDIIIDVDSDHAGCRSTRKSTTGLLARRTGHIIHELSATQPVVSLNSGESELILHDCEGYHNCTLLAQPEVLCRDLHVVEVGQLRVRSDSSAGRGMISKLGVGKRAKHIDTQFLFVQTVIQDKTVLVECCRGTENPEDLATKYASLPLLQHLMAKLPVRVLMLAALTLRVHSKEVTGHEVREETSWTS